MDDGKASDTVNARIKTLTGQWMMYAMMGVGMYGLNGVNPKVTCTMLNIFVIPAILHGLETVRLTHADYRKLATCSIPAYM